uniref:Uncharacterized protein n=2 Tax=Cercopithecinae TaxID=9528 RepID=A0A8D2K541_THEGE|nr:unnamed protein product [Macaca fascicularis]
MELPTPFFIEGSPLDLIKVLLGYAAVFEMNMHQPLQEQNHSSEKRSSVVY